MNEEKTGGMIGETKSEMKGERKDATIDVTTKEVNAVVDLEIESLVGTEMVLVILGLQIAEINTMIDRKTVVRTTALS